MRFYPLQDQFLVEFFVRISLLPSSSGIPISISRSNLPGRRKAGRFDREIEIGIPDDEGRYEILNIHTRGMPLDDKVDLQQISKVTHGFVGADLEMLAKESAMRSLRRILPEIDLEEDKISSEILQKIKITREDFREALKEVRPSALREVLVQIPNVTWDDIGGLESLKE